MAKPQLTFSPGVAGWLHEGAHTVYWLVHPFRPVLAAGVACGGLLPVVWLISLPLRLIGITVSAVVALMRAVLFLPARLLGGRRV